MQTSFTDQSLSPAARRAIGEINARKNTKARSGELQATVDAFLRTKAQERSLAREALMRRILANEGATITLNAMIRRLVAAPMSEDHKAVLRALGEDSGGGATYISEDIGPDLFDVLALTGAWNTLGVRRMGSKQGKFSVVTATPNAQFIGEGIPWSDDTTFAGSSVQAEAGTIGVLLDVSMRLVDDIEADLLPDFIEKFERAVNARLDHACFVGDGTADGDNGGTTGLFEAAGITAVVAASGNTTAQTLDHEDFLRVLDAAPAGVLQRGAAWWIHPSLLVRVMRVEDGSGESIVKTAMEGGPGDFSILGYPVNLVAAAPSANEAGAKIAVFGEPGGYLVGIRQSFVLEGSDHRKWKTLQRSYRAHTRAKGVLRSADAFVMLQTAES